MPERSLEFSLEAADAVKSRDDLLREVRELRQRMREAGDGDGAERAEERLAAAPTLSEALLEHSWDSIKTLDLDGKLLSMNPAGLRMLGVSELSRCLGKPWVDFWAGPDRERAVAALAEAKAGRVGKFTGSSLISGDGSKWWDVVITRIPPARLLVISRDVTDRKGSEDATAQQSIELERKSRELARSNAELELFASIVSHDLRSPLLSITGCVELLSEQAHSRLSPEDRELIAMVRSSVRTMGDLIKGLLDYSRVDAGGVKIAPCSCERILQRARAGLSKIIEEKKAQLTHDPLPTVAADEKLLLHVFQNVLENALKYHGSEPPRIHVSARQSAEGWVFAVSDNGIGIPEELRERIFGMFKRLHRDESRYRGSGIGLATCRKIIERHGGRIWVESQLGAGSTFYWTLPAG